MPFLMCLDIRRQDEGWPPTTYITIGTKDYDLTCEFALVTEANIIAAIKDRWSSPTVQTDKHPSVTSLASSLIGEMPFGLDW
jgi:hypothetical protein